MHNSITTNNFSKILISNMDFLVFNSARDRYIRSHTLAQMYPKLFDRLLYINPHDTYGLPYHRMSVNTFYYVPGPRVLTSNYVQSISLSFFPLFDWAPSGLSA